MLEKIMKKYEKYEKEKYTGEFNPNKGLEKVKDTCNPNKEFEKVEETAIKLKEGKLNELTFRDKSDVFLSDKMVKHACFGTKYNEFNEFILWNFAFQAKIFIL